MTDLRSGAQLYAQQVTTCQRKRPYLSRQTAANAAWLLNALGRNLQPYRCPICADWHLATRRSA